MQYDFDSATKRMQQELNDPLLKVVFDDEIQEYQVLKWQQTGCDRGYYMLQNSYKEWREPEIIRDFKMGSYEHFDIKQFRQNMKESKEKADMDSRKNLREASGEYARDIYRYYMHPNIVSIPGVKTTRLQGR